MCFLFRYVVNPGTPWYPGCHQLLLLCPVRTAAGSVTPSHINGTWDAVITTWKHWATINPVETLCILSAPQVVLNGLWCSWLCTFCFFYEESCDYVVFWWHWYCPQDRYCLLVFLENWCCTGCVDWGPSSAPIIPIVVLLAFCSAESSCYSWLTPWHAMLCIFLLNNKIFWW